LLKKGYKAFCNLGNTTPLTTFVKIQRIELILDSFGNLEIAGGEIFDKINR
jgi:hypothetical protein